jgi:hypothetical protein
VKAEAPARRGRLVRVGGRRGIPAQQQQRRLERPAELRHRHALRLALPTPKKHQPVALRAGENHRHDPGRLRVALAPEGNAGERPCLESDHGRLSPPGIEAERTERREQLLLRIGRRKLAQEKPGIEGHAVQCA